MTKQNNFSMQFLSLDIYNGKYRDFLEKIKNPEKPTLVFTPNPEILVRASRERDFFELLKKADYLTPDANGLYVGAMMQEDFSFLRSGLQVLFHKKSIEGKYGELIKGSDLTRDLLEYAAREKKSVLILDNRVTEIRDEFEKKKADIQKNMKELLEEKYPGINVHVILDGDMTPDGIAYHMELEHISYVFSCLGMQKQEQALVDIWSYLSSQDGVVWIGVWASIDFLLGLQKRAPVIVQKLWLEWLYRLMQNPRKRWRRIWDAFVEFPRQVERFDK